MVSVPRWALFPLTLLVLAHLSGCGLSEKKVVSIRYSSGCVIDVSGAEVESGRQLPKNWSIEDCKIESKEEE